jgi:hypothetical protein
MSDEVCLAFLAQSLTHSHREVGPVNVVREQASQSRILLVGPIRSRVSTDPGVWRHLLVGDDVGMSVPRLIDTPQPTMAQRAAQSLASRSTSAGTSSQLSRRPRI